MEAHTFSYSGSQQIKDLNDWHLATGSSPPKSLEFGMVTTGDNSQLPDGDYHLWLVGDDDDANDLRQVPYAIP